MSIMGQNVEGRGSHTLARGFLEVSRSRDSKASLILLECGDTGHLGIHCHLALRGENTAMSKVLDSSGKQWQRREVMTDQGRADPSR